ncbi:DUF885 domain-containing protein [Sphingomonas sp. Leaf34]|uniref:DUF885 domain-containing protein n=1 Tax=Sphingomonas sp. Leaf34 TaxID=1736216 RepID=UPI001F412E01|nr:DUF885 domain-containing protein [Sphingomonas sp. Leaf34]
MGHAARLRAPAKAKAIAGERFDVKHFHDVLEAGAMPLTMLERIAEEHARGLSGMLLRNSMCAYALKPSCGRSDRPSRHPTSAVHSGRRAAAFGWPVRPDVCLKREGKRTVRFGGRTLGRRPLNRHPRCISLLHRRNPRFPAALWSMQNL